MSFLENMKLAVASLKAHKMRVLLAILGIIIGISAVIIIVTVGEAISKSVSSEMQNLGANNILVRLKEKDAQTSSLPPILRAAPAVIPEDDLMNNEMIHKLKERFPEEIVEVSVLKSAGSAKVQEGRLSANVTVAGVNEGFAVANNLKLLNGRFLKEEDQMAKRYVAVVSDKLMDKLFDKDTDPIGSEIKLSMGNNLQTFSVIGVYKYEQATLINNDTSADQDVTTNLFMPLTTSNMITSSSNGFQNFTVMTRMDVNSAEFADEIKNFLSVFYQNNPRYEINTTTMDYVLSIANDLLSTVSIAVSLIAGISLIVGGIGVMNIMLVSVTERTREIGTKKALGAKQIYIKIQFITEAAVICGIGGVIGVFFGVIIGYISSSLLGFPMITSLPVILIAVLFSMTIGVFFGYYPSNKAANMDPIEALRYE
ncbi:ABC transporter permease [Paenibacillus lentus]|uniref:ABC transporter permease n=1 Tax=Paenibacillus lentus TaxID=1338368 RepID=UPI003648884D